MNEKNSPKTSTQTPLTNPINTQNSILPWLVVGTIPDVSFPLTLAPVRLDSAPSVKSKEHDTLCLGNDSIPVNRGTPALLTAMANMAVCLGAHTPFLALVAGDTGGGAGSRAVYRRLAGLLKEQTFSGITFHYLMPDVDWHNRILMTLEALQSPPLLVADAGFMYAAKMSGYAAKYDLFTPDIGELAFLADQEAPHPFYTRNFFLADESAAPDLIAKAHAQDNAARHMLVKGKVDRFVCEGKTLFAIDQPDTPALEPVGGTGDTITGIVTACLAAGMPMTQACSLAMRLNRQMGALASPTPASSIAELLQWLPEAVRREGRGE